MGMNESRVLLCGIKDIKVNKGIGLSLKSNSSILQFLYPHGFNVNVSDIANDTEIPMILSLA